MLGIVRSSFDSSVLVELLSCISIRSGANGGIGITTFGDEAAAGADKGTEVLSLTGCSRSDAEAVCKFELHTFGDN